MIRAFRLWFYEGADGTYEGDHPVELSREMAEVFRAEGLADVPDDIDWVVEQEAYYDVIDGKIAWMIVLCGGYQPLVPIATAQARPETAARQIVC